jgi:RecJ-like exonuclease
MSKGNSRARKSVTPPTHHQGFVRISHKRCPDCEYEGNLSTDGRPINLGSRQLRGASQYVGTLKATRGCETCGGTGVIEIHKLDPESIDPYARKDTRPVQPLPTR